MALKSWGQALRDYTAATQAYRESPRARIGAAKSLLMMQRHKEAIAAISSLYESDLSQDLGYDLASLRKELNSRRGANDRTP